MQKVCVSEERFSRSSDAAAVQAAIDSLGSAGGTVVIPRRNPRTGKAEWRFDRAVVLKSHVTLIADNAVLTQETDSFSHLITAEAGAEDISFIGEGNVLLSGGQTSRLKTTTSGLYGLPDISVYSMCCFSKVKGLTLKNFEIKDPHWVAIVLTDSEQIRIENIRFDSCPTVPEEGGIRVYGNSKDIEIKNLTGRTGFHTTEFVGEDGKSIEKVRIRNILTDPGRGALVSLRTWNGGKVRDVGMDVLMDSSDYYEKARSASVLAFGRLTEITPYAGRASSANAVSDDEIPADRSNQSIAGITGKNFYSRAVNAIEILQPFSDATITNLMTFGDNIAAIGTRSTQTHELKNVVFDRIFYGAGSKPNNATSFISRSAKGAQAVMLRNVTGCTIRRLYTQEEEA